MQVVHSKCVDSALVVYGVQAAMSDLLSPGNRRHVYYRSGSCERERLLKKLIETEMDGQEASRQASSLKVRQFFGLVG